ncbi:hypothetical protein M434DRAFT_32781 [Hypoxylon sp. CO27-5]|nr:hypothetical protein M434DRAFT_32781 [Hypoxylon sp. CO27-5]
MTVAIGDEIRESSALAEKMNDTFDSTRLRLRGTMNRMLVMAERTGVGWKVWLGFFAAVIFIFFYRAAALHYGRRCGVGIWACGRVHDTIEQNDSGFRKMLQILVFMCSFGVTRKIQDWPVLDLYREEE